MEIHIKEHDLKAWFQTVKIVYDLLTLAEELAESLASYPPGRLFNCSINRLFSLSSILFSLESTKTLDIINKNAVKIYLKADINYKKNKFIVKLRNPWEKNLQNFM